MQIQIESNGSSNRSPIWILRAGTTCKSIIKSNIETNWMETLKAQRGGCLRDGQFLAPQKQQQKEPVDDPVGSQLKCE